ncbi:glycosidase [Propioniciclava soli]|uniref:Glycosidase n=1 Tax=Propioniciclava soli TaxID=2775081 RepID=A0ABZ3C8E1_9ACTN|nr:glycosidase [Propioniciclava soli]
MSHTDFPYTMTRRGVVMTPDRSDPHELEGVLNPAAARAPDGRLVLFPRVVAAGNRSRIAVADVVVTDGVPTGVERRGIVLSPDRGWERGSDHGGVEDPRITWIEALGLYVMTYVAYGPLGPRAALATSSDLATWTRLGPVQFRYEDHLDTDLNLFPNKDLVWFPEPIPGPEGELCFGFIHRPMWRIRGQEVSLPAGVTDDRAAIWLSYVRVSDALADPAALLRPFGHREIARSETAWEALKIGGGPPPVRVPEGWLLIYHGVSGTIIEDDFAPQKDVHYAAGAMILDAADPSRVVARTAHPLLTPETERERVGIVGNVVFPTAIVEVDGRLFTFYGMADEAIGVASLDRATP